MFMRRKTSFLVSLFLTTGIAYAQQPSPPSTPAPPEALTQVWSNDFSVFVDGNSFLGVYAEDIDKEKMATYGLREARGVGITEVVSGSPAEKAGLRKGDVILRFDNDNVTSVRKLNRLVSEVAPDQTVRLHISRGGAEQEVAVTMGERKNFGNATVRSFPRGEFKLRDLKNYPDFAFAFGNNRRIGISTTTLTKQLADYFGIVDGKGVLVTSVSEDGPAAKAGLKAGDVITAVDGEKIDGAGDISRAINKKKDGDVTLTIIRNKHQQNVTVTPKASEPLVPGSQRRVIVPSIDLGTIPAVDISIPSIQLPSIPEINVNIPTKVIVQRGGRQPI